MLFVWPLGGRQGAINCRSVASFFTASNFLYVPAVRGYFLEN